MKNQNSENKTAGRSLGVRFWIIFSCGVVVLIAGGVLMCRYEPGAYQPQAPINPKEISPYLTHKLGPDFFNQVQLDEPFVLEVEQAGLNDILSRLPAYQAADDTTFSNYVVIFEESAIYLMGTLEYKGVRSVVTLQAKPLMTAENEINCNIQSIRMGLLPVTTLVSKLAHKAFADNLTAFEGEPQAEQMTRAILANGPFEPVFTVNSRSVRIRRFEIKQGLLTLTCEPVSETPVKLSGAG